MRREAARSLAPLGSLPPASVLWIAYLQAEIWEENASNSQGFFFFLLRINPDEVSFLLFPFGAVIFLMRSKCFGVPFPRVLGEV